MDAGTDSRLGHLRVAEQERRRPAGGIGPVVGHRLELDAPAASLLADRLLVVAVGQLDGHVQPGGDAADGGVRERFGERLDERIAPVAVAGSHPAQVAVELAAGQEVGECVLLDAGGAPVGEQLLGLTASRSEGGTTSQPIRSAGASVLLAEPA